MTHALLDRAATALAGLYVLDRAAKLAAVVDFFRRPVPPAPAAWPSLTLVQPVTAGATDLAHNLRSRLRTGYHGALNHVVVCDAEDADSLAVCRAVFADAPNVRIVTVAGEGIALK